MESDYRYGVVDHVGEALEQPRVFSGKARTADYISGIRHERMYYAAIEPDARIPRADGRLSVMTRPSSLIE
ncbi:hypothetical protein [Nocardia mexicana]|uniref:Uncharacterized protein n=1 Tax=Nocardia mexicana TaxID=279262 RepID=A0A370HB95_9NOCA|nr:hypothetical protein [Nocardia mexicana]RDI53334.1 hypothetical protein DFR68_103723 [Nocardia mexicana]